MTNPIVSASAPLDLDACFRRIGYTGHVEPSVAVLEGLHPAHATRIPC